MLLTAELSLPLPQGVLEAAVALKVTRSPGSSFPSASVHTKLTAFQVPALSQQQLASLRAVPEVD